MIKKYDRARFREKFRRYRIFFALSALLFLAALVGEAVLYGAGGYDYLGGSVIFRDFLTKLVTGETLLYLAVFFLGVTVYAPFFGFLTAALRGALSGFCLSLVFSSAKEEGGVLLLIFTFLYLVGSAWLFMGYSSFCTTVALRLYSDSAAGSVRGEEKRQFGGTLFCSDLFCNTINLRFLFSYFLFFLAAIFFSLLLALLYAFLRTLI